MNLIEGMLKNSTIKNSKGGKYYSTTYNSNLDLFSGANRYTDTNVMILQFRNAFCEDKVLATANLLYFLDIRQGKGERNIFKTLFKELCNIDKDMSIIVLNQIGNLGRWDYILEALNTPIEKEALDIIKSQLEKDINSENPSLLAKWLPSVRTHNKQKDIAKELYKKLEMNESQYRKTISSIRRKINLIETLLSEKKYNEINFENIPTKAMLKYRDAFERHCEDKYSQYLSEANKGNVNINTTGLFCYDIINKIEKSNINRELANAMWEQQKDILKDNKDNILVMADTSGSMTWYPNVYETSIGLALYIAERNHGIFKDYYMTFDTDPRLQKVTGADIVDKVRNIIAYYGNTNIDKAFKLLLDTAVDNKIEQSDMPSHIIIVSDMEFDIGCTSQNGTNFSGWEKSFQEKGYKLPTIIFWNVNTKGFPVSKFDNNVCMINGFSTSVLENILDLEDFTPMKAMINSLQKYINIIEKGV